MERRKRCGRVDRVDIGALFGGRRRLGRRAAVRLSKTGAQYAPAPSPGGKIASRKGQVVERAGDFPRNPTIVPRIASTASRPPTAAPASAPCWPRSSASPPAPSSSRPPRSSCGGSAGCAGVRRRRPMGRRNPDRYTPADWQETGRTVGDPYEPPPGLHRVRSVRAALRHPRKGGARRPETHRPRARHGLRPVGAERHLPPHGLPGTGHLLGATVGRGDGGSHTLLGFKSDRLPLHSGR